MKSHHSYFVDAHCHLSDKRIWNHAVEFIARASRQNIKKLMIGGVSSEEWGRQLELKKQFPEMIRTSFGIHPWWVEKFSSQQLENELQLLTEQISIADALGETGLDFHHQRDSSRFQEQEHYFRQQIQIAREKNKPLVLHVVSAHEKALQIMNEEKGFSLPLMIHRFSGSKEQAKLWLRLGAFLSFGDALLHPHHFEKTKSALKEVPLSQILFETDAPDTSLPDLEINEPSRVLKVYEEASRLLGVDLALLQEKVAENFTHFG